MSMKPGWKQVIKSTRTEEGDVYFLIKQIQQHPDDEKAKEQLVLRYRGLVHAVAKKYSRKRDNQEDLAQVGMIGLLLAANRYDESHGAAFETYAIPTIIGEIKRFIRDKTWSVHVPRKIKELGPKINMAVDELTNVFERSPTVAEIAAYVEVSEEDILETMEMTSSYKALSVDYPREIDTEGSTMSILDMIGMEEEKYEKLDIHMVLEGIFPILPVREQQILYYIYFEQLSQSEVGKLLGISQMHVSRLQRRSLRKLREVLERETYVHDMK